ncbi:MAG: hypothetical protein C4292_06790 [Nitrososphaera sp.]
MYFFAAWQQARTAKKRPRGMHGGKQQAASGRFFRQIFTAFALQGSMIVDIAGGFKSAAMCCRHVV